MSAGTLTKDQRSVVTYKHYYEQDIRYYDVCFVPNLVDDNEMLAISEMKHPIWLVDA